VPWEELLAWFKNGLTLRRLCRPSLLRNIHAEHTALNRRQFGFLWAMDGAVGIARQCNSYSTDVPDSDAQGASSEGPAGGTEPAL
jgi:hypothetical protein